MLILLLEGGVKFPSLKYLWPTKRKLCQKMSLFTFLFHLFLPDLGQVQAKKYNDVFHHSQTRLQIQSSGQLKDQCKLLLFWTKPLQPTHWTQASPRSLQVNPQQPHFLFKLLSRVTCVTLPIHSSGSESEWNPEDWILYACIYVLFCCTLILFETIPIYIVLIMHTNVNHNYVVSG